MFIKVSDKKKKLKPQFEKNDLVRTAEKKNCFSKGDTEKCELHTSPEIITDLLSIFHTEKLPERKNEALLKKSEPTVRKWKCGEKMIFISVEMTLSKTVI